MELESMRHFLEHDAQNKGLLNQDYERQISGMSN